MAVQRVVQFVDDLDGTAAAETVWFGVDGVGYEVDLSAANAAALRTLLDPYVTAGRRVGRVEAGAAGRVRHALARAQSAASAPRSPVAAAVQPEPPPAAEPPAAAPAGPVAPRAAAELAAPWAAPAEPPAPRPEAPARAEPGVVRFSDQVPPPAGH